ncbi:hypothetical protein CA831_10570 [Burkholderia multivorans]|nr:hypothetical protein CA831_10570 [Burkholderia multivorans]
MQKRLLHSFIPLAIAAAYAFAPAHADESARAVHDTWLRDAAPGMPTHDGAGIIAVSAPRPVPTGKMSVTLWDEIGPPAPLPTPLPAPQPSDVQHAMHEGAETNVHQ